MSRRLIQRVGVLLLTASLGLGGLAGSSFGQAAAPKAAQPAHGQQLDFISMLFVFVLSTFIGIGVVRRVSRLLHTPLMSITNAISAIAVVGSILVTGSDYPLHIRILGSIALFASMTNIVSGFLITDRMLKMFKTRDETPKGGQK
jgi:NAD(P) transhydrogenase subunit alpha